MDKSVKKDIKYRIIFIGIIVLIVAKLMHKEKIADIAMFISLIGFFVIKICTSKSV